MYIRFVIRGHAICEMPFSCANACIDNVLIQYNIIYIERNILSGNEVEKQRRKKRRAIQKSFNVPAEYYQIKLPQIVLYRWNCSILSQIKSITCVFYLIKSIRAIEEKGEKYRKRARREKKFSAEFQCISVRVFVGKKKPKAKGEYIVFSFENR